MEQEQGQNIILSEMPKSRYAYIADGLPFEDIDPECLENKDINGMVQTLWDDISVMESYAIVVNRFSENYRIVSRELENMLRKMGSLLITQAVLQQQGYQIITPEDLSVGSLSFLVNYHFNKAHAAAHGTQMVNPRFYTAMLAQEVRWISLQQRLGATEEKIREIREGKTLIRKQDRKASEPVKKAGSGDSTGDVKASAPAALPVINDLLPDNDQKAGIRKQETSARTDASRGVTEETPSALLPEPAETAEVRNDVPREPEAGEDEEKMMRDILLQAAIFMGDRESYEWIAAADGGGLRSAWEYFMEKETENGCPILNMIRKRDDEPDDPPPDEDLSIPLDEAFVRQPAYCL